MQEFRSLSRLQVCGNNPNYMQRPCPTEAMQCLASRHFLSLCQLATARMTQEAFPASGPQNTHTFTHLPRWSGKQLAPAYTLNLHILNHRSHYQRMALPNPSVKRTANGVAPGP